MQFVCLLVIKYLYLRQIVEGTTFLLLVHKNCTTYGKRKTFVRVKE